VTTHSHDVQKEIRTYLAVFGGLLFFTIVTVAASYLHLSLAKAITLALIIATVKAGLVACYFMHLISEQRLVYIGLSMTVIFFFGLLFLPIGNYHDNLVGTEHHVAESVSPDLH
jgi:cytochrome c oxidase subunit 4